MKKINKPRYGIRGKKEYFLLLIFFSLLMFSFAQGQTPNVDLTWSTDTYIPLDYPGKALPTRGSRVEVVANVDPEASAQELVYTWLINDKVQENKSGKGRQILEFNLGESLNQKYEIKVNISDEKNSFNVSSPDLAIIPQKPEIIVEAKLQPIEVLSLVKGYVVSSGQNIRFVAQPYFFNINSAQQLDYVWKFGQEEATLDSSNNPNIFNLEISKLNTSIIRDLTVWAENKNSAIEKTSATLEINIIP